MIEWMMQMIGDVGNYLVNILPTSPFSDYIDSFEPPACLGWLSWFFPVHDLRSHDQGGGGKHRAPPCHKMLPRIHLFQLLRLAFSGRCGGGIGVAERVLGGGRRLGGHGCRLPHPFSRDGAARHREIRAV